MRAIRQPGPAPAERAVCLPVRAITIEAELPAGTPLLAALAGLVAAHGADGACLALEGGAFSPFGYVMPALSPDAAHAAWYSAPFHPPGTTRWARGCVTLGVRDGAPFFHCHGIWTEADGRRRGGHVLPEATVIAAPIRAHGAAFLGARFAANPDPETGFTLFAPEPTAPPRDPNALALRLRPNQDITAALEALARTAGFGAARLAGGVGSIIGARFADGSAVHPFVTEMFVADSQLRGTDATTPPSRLAAGLVDLSGALAEGALVPGDNPVLMTLEAVLLPA